MKLQNMTGLIKKSELDVSLDEYIILGEQIKELEKRKEKLKVSLIKSYFISHATYKSKDGTIAASLLPQVRNILDAQTLKDKYPTLCETYTRQQEIQIFSVKRIKS